MLRLILLHIAQNDSVHEERNTRHTVNCNGNTFRQFIAIGAMERGDFAELVELHILCGDIVLVNDDLFQIELVRLGNSFDADGASIALRSPVSRQDQLEAHGRVSLHHACTVSRMPCLLRLRLH